MHARNTIESPDELEALENGSVIEDGGGLLAVKLDGAWYYGQERGGYWEPEAWPITLIAP
ncbi:hypothetical protein SEA_KUDEFRE_1 [Gordonia phage Kudefre]|uniref:Uncharacterized protein n=1 Tax=Gordonia phage Kudefre TaxID=2885975 RepID=A0AAE9C2W6_9CAUD|nr:hypothetical protein L3Y24_gp001 [Gordonia phage Kudefre]UDL15236.1 hypothetical protein SEA_KUDEFRE_1 [Gordonia phage Kudefre]